MAIQTTWDLQPQARPAPVSSDPSITMSPAQTQQRIAQMNRETLAQASPVGRATEEARMAGRITSEQGNAIREYSQGYRETPFSPPSQEPVFTSNAARQDLTNIRTMIDRMSQGIASQAEMNRLNEVQRQQGATNAPPTADDISRSLAERYGDSSATDSFGAAPVSGGTAPPATQDSFTERLSRTTENSLNQQADAYNEWKSSMDQLRRGTIPLTPEQTAQVDAINAAAQRAIAQQEIANKNYTGGMTQLGIRTGMNVYSPDVAFGYIKQATDQGISKIQDIEQKAIESVAKLKEGFREQNYKLINDQYEKLTGLLDKRQSTITDLLKTINQHEKDTRDYNQKAEQFERQQTQKEEQDRITNERQQQEFTATQTQRQFENSFNTGKFTYQQGQDAIKNALDSRQITDAQARDLRDYNFKVQQLEQGKYIISTDAYGRPVAFNTKTGKFEPNALTTPSGNTPGGPDTGAWNDAFSNASLGLTDKDQKTRLGQLNGLLAQGKTAEAKDMLIRVATQTATADQRNQALGRNTAIDGLNAVQSLLNAYVKKSGDTGILSGNIEAAAQKMGRTGNPELAAIGSQIQQILQVYRKGMTGVAFSPVEAAEYSKIFPDITNVNELNGTKIKSLIDSFNRNQRSFIGGQIGQTNYDKIFGAATQVSDVGSWASEHPQEWSNVEQMGRANGWDEEETLQFINSLNEPDASGGSGFNQPLSMGEKGSDPMTALSEKFESSGDPGVIGYDSTGGFSYGAYQLAHNNAQKFVNQSEYAEDFKGLPFNSEAFKNKWKEVARRDPEGFKAAQKQFVEDTHFAPQANKLLALGVGLSSLPPVLKAVVFSTAVQHGANNNIIVNAIKKFGTSDPAKLIRAIYEDRWSGGKRFANSTPEVRKSVYNRFFGKNGEIATALKQVRA